MVISQRVIDILNFTWTSVHDFVYLGLYAALTHLHIVKHKKDANERLSAIEKILNIPEG